MAYVDITGSNLEIFLNYRDKDVTTPPTDHLLGPIQLAVLGVTSPDVVTLLTTPLSDTFNGLWTALQPTVIAQVQAAVTSARSGAYDIQVRAPASGTLRAQVGFVSPGLVDKLPPNTSGKQLTLSFWLGGFDIDFSATTDSLWGGWADPSYNLKFDAELLLAIAVPDDPHTPIGFVTEFHTQNSQASAGNLFAVMIGIEDAVGAYFANTVSNATHPPETFTPLTIPQLVAIFAQLSNGFGLAANVGFRKLDAFIDPNPVNGSTSSAASLRLLHPDDPAPEIRDALTPQGPSLFHPVIGTSAPQVNAGGSLRQPSARAGSHGSPTFPGLVASLPPCGEGISGDELDVPQAASVEASAALVSAKGRREAMRGAYPWHSPATCRTPSNSSMSSVCSAFQPSARIISSDANDSRSITCHAFNSASAFNCAS